MTVVARSPTPFHTAAWYDHAGWTQRVTMLRYGAAAAAVWLGGRPAHHFHDIVALLTAPDGADPDDALVAAVRARRDLRVLLTISPYGYRGGIGPVSEADAMGLASAVVAHGHAVGADLVVSHYLYDEDDAAWLAALRHAGGTAALLGADAVLDVCWDDLGGYQRWLGASRRSLRYGKAARPDWPAPSTAVDTPLNGLAAERIVDLLVASRHADPAPTPRSLLAAAVAGDDLRRTLLALPDPGTGEPRSVAVLLRSPAGLYAKFFGSSVPRTDYFALAYTHVLDYAIRTGHRRIHYGGGAHQAKLFRGARLRPGWGVLLPLTAAAEPVVELAVRVGIGKRVHFGWLAQRWQLAQLPLDPAFTVTDPEEDAP